jgi:hypothetical protein
LDLRPREPLTQRPLKLFDTQLVVHGYVVSIAAAPAAKRGLVVGVV